MKLTVWLTCDESPAAYALFGSEPEYKEDDCVWLGEGIMGVLDVEGAVDNSLIELLGGKCGPTGIVKLSIEVES